MRAPKIAVVGAGISGICTGIQLKKQLGVNSFTIYEKASSLGGTWRDNTYPGAACDVPSHFYSFSFEMNPNWSCKWSPQPEILSYLEGVASKHNLHPHFRFQTEVVSASWVEERSQWKLLLSNKKKGAEQKGEEEEEEEVFVDFLISGVGQLSRPFYPTSKQIPGIEEFRGKMMHSARWDTTYDVAGKDVAIIGTGASAAQIIPAIAPIVRNFQVYQRTPNWVLPRGPVTRYSDLTKWIFAHVPFVMAIYRRYLFLVFDKNFLAFRKGSWINKFLQKECAKLLNSQVKDAKLREALLPNYPVGCKRLLFMDELFPALARSNVQVITEPIKSITKDSITTDSGTHSVECIILATGFQTQSFLAPMTLTGRGGMSLEEKWHKGAEAYRGIAISGFPNFFTLYGPNSNLGHHSIIFMIECQVNYVMKVVKAWMESEIGFLDIRSEVQRDYNAQLQSELSNTVWAHGCKSWYVSETGAIRNNWSGTVTNYWLSVNTPKFSDFEIRDRHGKVVSSEEVQKTVKGLPASLAAIPTAAIFIVPFIAFGWLFILFFSHCVLPLLAF